LDVVKVGLVPHSK
jgi:hypothetical protein